MIDGIALTTIDGARHVTAVAVRRKTAIADGQGVIKAAGKIAGRDVCQVMVVELEFVRRDSHGEQAV